MSQFVEVTDPVRALSDTGTLRTLARQRAEAEASLARQPEPKPDQPPKAWPPLRVPERAPGRVVGSAMVAYSLNALYRQLTVHSRGWPKKRKTALEAALVELEAVLDPDRGKALAEAAARVEAVRLAAEEAETAETSA